MNSDSSLFMLPNPDLNQVKDDLLISYPDLKITPVFKSLKQNRLAIINTANRAWSIVETDYLHSVLPSFQIKEFYFSPGGKPFQGMANKLDEEVIQADSVNELVDQLKSFAPSTIYLRVSPHTKSEFLISVCRLLFPDLVLIVEPYDLSCLIDAKVLGYGSDQAPAYQESLQACAVALHCCEGLVVKMGGERFERLDKPFPERFISMFPISEKGLKNWDDGLVKTKPESRQILYAGSASARELLSGIGTIDGANLIRYFDRVVLDEHLDLTIINGAHFTEQENTSPKFSELISRYTDASLIRGKASYSRAMPLEDLTRLAINFDLGICCAHYAEDHVVEVTRVSIPNRMTTYLNAGLPVIIDDRFEFASSLISSFKAGKVVPAGNINEFSFALNTLDITEAKNGVRLLKQYLQAENNKNLASLLLTIR